MDSEKFSAMICAAVKAKFASELERLGILLASAKPKLNTASSVVDQLRIRLAETVRFIPLDDPRPGLPRGIDRVIFFVCVSLASVVTIGDGLNASLLAARELQSLIAGLAFLLPALCAPLVAKAAIARLHPRSVEYSLARKKQFPISKAMPPPMYLGRKVLHHNRVARREWQSN
jgi:hypothetical protein